MWEAAPMTVVTVSRRMMMIVVTMMVESVAVILGTTSVVLLLGRADSYAGGVLMVFGRRARSVDGGSLLVRVGDSQSVIVYVHVTM